MEKIWLHIVKADSLYQIISKEKNSFSEWPKKYKMFYQEKRKAPIVLPPAARYPDKPTKQWTLQEFSFCHYKWTPRPIQSEIFRIVRSRREEFYYGASLISLKTGKWKTHIVMMLSDYFKQQGHKVVILCHNTKTITETCDKFKEFTDITPSLYYGVKKKLVDPQVLVTTHSSFINAVGEIPLEWTIYRPDVVIYDECDYSASPSMFSALAKSWAREQYSLTGTPYRDEFDAADMQNLYGKIISVEIEDAQYEYIPTIYQFRAKKVEELYYSDFIELKDTLMNHEPRSATIVALIKKIMQSRDYLLIIADRVAEGQELTQLLQESGETATFICGDTSAKSDKAELERIAKSKKGIILWTAQKVSRWMDVPWIDSVFLLGSIAFRWAVVQAVWRSLRRSPWKNNVAFFDFSDYSFLPNQAYERNAAYEKEYGSRASHVLKLQYGQIDFPDLNEVTSRIKTPWE